MIHSIQAVFRRDRSPQISGHRKMFRAAVMVPLLQTDEGWSILFQVRGYNLRSQPGEICFPGGRIEKFDSSEEAAAVRETCEELGILPDDLEVLAPLDIFVPSHAIIYPFLGRLRSGVEIRPDSTEVAEVFTVPLEALLAQEPKLHYVPVEMKPGEDFPYELIPRGRQYKWRTGQVAEYFYQHRDKVIWGLTAKILHDFLETYRLNRDESLRHHQDQE